MILWLTVICLLLWAYIIGKTNSGIHAAKLAVFSVCGFFFLYTVVSAGFFWADRFGFEKTLGVCLACEAVATIAVTIRCRRNGDQALLPKVSFDGKAYWIPLVIMLAALPFTWNKFELYSMGQDQGTYQVKALALLAYDTHNYMEMEEFNKLDTPEEKQKYLDFVYSQNNLYLPRVIEETETDASQFDRIVGTIHGLPTYSALLALWGAMFGYANMIGVQTILYICLIFLSFFVAENMKLKRTTGAWITLLTAFSPIVIWCSKSSLTELGLAVIFTVFLYILTGEKEHAWLAWIPLTVFAFFHISIYIFMPVLVILLFMMYFMQREKGWLISAVGTLIGYGVSAFWAFDIAPYYSYGNYSVLFKLTRNIINQDDIKQVIVVLCVLLAAAAVLLMTRWGKAPADRLQRLPAESRIFKNGVVWLIRLALAGSFLFFVYKGFITAEYTRYFEYLQISTFTYMTGLILVPFLYGYLFCKPGKVLENGMMAAFVLLFFYCIIAYSAFMRLHVTYYYYYARYVTIFLGIIFLLAGRLAEDMERGRWAVPVIFAAALLTFLPYDTGLPTQKDHTRCEWEVLADVCEDITSEDAFIVGPEEQQIVFIFPVKLLTGCDVYYADEDLRGQIGKLAQKYQNVYYLDYEGALDTIMSEDALWQDGTLAVSETYTNWNHLSYLDYFNITNPLTPIPLNYVQYRLKLSMHRISLNG